MAAFVLAAAALALPAAASAFSRGADSLGDPLFPQIGNGGYDVSHYDLALSYDPVANALGAGTRTTITATATHDLSGFSLDFQRALTVSSVTVDGQPARFRQRNAKPRFSRKPGVTQPAKLQVFSPVGIPAGGRFEVAIDYSGVPKQITDADESFEGWVRACSSPGNCDGSFTVNEPIGAQSWFPCNDYMTDKATFTTAITVPDGYTALGTGELTSRAPAPGGNTTWSWNEDDPTATYLTSATVGKFDYDDTQALFERRGGVTLPIYGAIDSAATPDAKASVEKTTARIPSMVDFLAKRYGAYPFDSVGYVADWVPSVGYALENQTKPHFAGTRTGPDVNAAELLHELSHQWLGDSVTGRSWQQIWFNEGWATFSEVYWEAKANDGKQSPRQFFRAVLTSKRGNFKLAPAKLRDPANLFSGFAVYNRPGAMLEGYREIVGNRRFFAFARNLITTHAYGTITERAFVRQAKRSSDLPRKRRARLGAYFRQWLHRQGKPRLTPADFRRGGGHGASRLRTGAKPRGPAGELRAPSGRRLPSSSAG